MLPQIDVIGKPYPKGSMVPMITKGPRPRAFLKPSNDFDLDRWNGKVIGAVRDVWRAPLLVGPVAVSLAFRLPRSSRQYHDKDLDKLTRTVLDCLTKAHAYKDDKQVVILFAMKYNIRANDPIPGVRINLAPLEETRHVLDCFLASLPFILPEPLPAA